MKKNTLLAVFCLGIALITSCKKTYSCDCEVKVYEAGAVVAKSESKESMSEKMSEAQAKSACDQTEKQLTSNFDEALEDPTLTTKASCDLD